MHISCYQTHCGQRTVRRRGFSLLEVLCAITIAAIMISVLFYGFDQGFLILKSTREDLRATQILMQQTEAVRLLTWSQLSTCPTNFQQYYNPTGSTNGPSSNTNSAGVTYYITMNTGASPTNIPNTVSYYTNIQLITINVRWTNENGIAHSRTMQTMNADYGMQNYLAGGTGE